MSTAQFFLSCKCLNVEAISCLTDRSVVVFVDGVFCISDVVPTSDGDATAIVVLFISSEAGPLDTFCFLFLHSLSAISLLINTKDSSFPKTECIQLVISHH